VANALRKRERHEQAIKTYETKVREITDNLEDKVRNNVGFLLYSLVFLLG